MARFYDLISEVLDGGEPFAMAIISGIKGSSPQKQGAKALFLPDGRIIGTVGGGCLEAELQDRARRALRTGMPATFELLLDHDFGWDDGLVCGGKVTGLILPNAERASSIWRELSRREVSRTWGVRRDFSIDWAEDTGEADDWYYRETVSPACALWIAGAGHVGQAVARFAADLDFEVTVFDDRPMLANQRYFPAGTRFQVGAWERLLETVLPERTTFGLIVTRGHQHDALALRFWVGREFAFLGMIGSQRKKRLIFERLLEDGYATQEQLDRVKCPVGLEIGSRTVPEIAVSIIAQLVKRRAEWRATGVEAVVASRKIP
jgi:xanthine dehydrogenase accessory factor